MLNFDEKEERERWRLTDKEFEENMEDIFGELALCSERTKKPSFIVVGGQAGSGKSALVAKEYSNLKENAIIIDQDELRTKFPEEKYRQIHDNYTEREEFLILKPYISRTILSIKDKARERGYNIILESALRSINSFIDITQELRKSGYNTKLSILAVPEVEANISMLTRYCYYLAKFGECRRNTRIDRSMDQTVKNNIIRLDNMDIFDDITIWIRGKELDSLPVQTYSSKSSTQITPLQAYIEGQTNSLEDTRRNFYIRYKHIKEILLENKEYAQLEKLEIIKDMFEKEKGDIR